MISDMQYAEFSKDAYNTYTEADVAAGNASFTMKDDSNWKVLKVSKDEATGYYGAAYLNEATGEIVVAYRGTQELGDVIPDIQIGVSNVPNQYDAAKQFYDEIADLAQGLGSPQPTITGHSLGGALGQLVGASTGTTTYTYNAPGVKGILENHPEMAGDGNYSNISNYNAQYDVISEFGTQIGNIHELSVSSFSGIPSFMEPVVAEFLGATGVAYFGYSQHSIDSIVNGTSGYSEFLVKTGAGSIEVLTETYSKMVEAAGAAAQYVSKVGEELGQALAEKAQQLINEAIEVGNALAEEAWKDVIQTIDKIGVPGTVYLMNSSFIYCPQN